MKMAQLLPLRVYPFASISGVNAEVSAYSYAGTRGRTTAFSVFCTGKDKIVTYRICNYEAIYSNQTCHGQVVRDSCYGAKD